MKEKIDYKNWLPGWLVPMGVAGSSFCAAAFAWVLTRKSVRGVRLFMGAATLLMTVLTTWAAVLTHAFSYNNEKGVARRILTGVSACVELPEGGCGLDVGCGSGALTIACAKGNPQAQMIGVDLWSKNYAYNRSVCEHNARLEGVSNVSFCTGDARKLDFSDEHFDAVTSNFVYHNIPTENHQALLLETLRVLKKGGLFVLHDIMPRSKYGDMEAFAAQLRALGYEEVQLIETTNGLFTSRGKAALMRMDGAKLLIGRK